MFDEYAKGPSVGVTRHVVVVGVKPAPDRVPSLLGDNIGDGDFEIGQAPSEGGEIEADKRPPALARVNRRQTIVSPGVAKNETTWCPPPSRSA